MSLRMKTKNNNSDKGYLFQKKNKVSVWFSTHPYADIPDEYFEETFFKNKTRAKNQWSDNFKMRYFIPENLETNGAMEETVSIKTAIKECSYADSFLVNLMSKAKKKNITGISWVVLLYEYEYSTRVSGIANDKYLTLLGAFDYDAAEEF